MFSRGVHLTKLKLFHSIQLKLKSEGLCLQKWLTNFKNFLQMCLFKGVCILELLVCSFLCNIFWLFIIGTNLLWMSKLDGTSQLTNIIISGPNLPIEIDGHSMVPLGQGQSILGGNQNKIYHITSSHQVFTISILSKEISVPSWSSVVIPIQDSMSKCFSGSKYLFRYWLILNNI